MTARRGVIIGGGTGGTITANRLRRTVPEHELQITVVDPSERHLYQPGLLFAPFGLADPEDLVRPRAAQLHHGIHHVRRAVDHVQIAENRVVLDDGRALDYDVLIVASVAVLLPEETEGLTGPLWNRNVFKFYDIAGAVALRDAVARLERGHLVVNVVDMPIKCPVAPLEVFFLADWSRVLAATCHTAASACPPLRRKQEVHDHRDVGTDHEVHGVEDGQDRCTDHP